MKELFLLEHLQAPGTFSHSSKTPDPDGPDPDGDPVNQITGVTGSNSWEYVKHLFEGSSPSGITLTFHNSQYSPFIVVEKENAVRGISGGRSSAYNLNEIMNRQLLDEETYEPFEPLGSSADIIYNQYSLVDIDPGYRTITTIHLQRLTQSIHEKS